MSGQVYVIGIDVGGTNTDAVLLRGNQVLALSKTPTDQEDLFASTRNALEAVLPQYDGSQRLRIQLSTTLSTNTIVEGRGAPVAIVAVPGPGMNLASHGFPFSIFELGGSIDHRGREVSPLVPEQIAQVGQQIPAQTAVGVVGKFSHRNPKHEQQLARLFNNEKRTFISVGHRLSGRSNFPRRIMTTYLNASVAQRQREFGALWTQLSEQLDLPLNEVLVLKADGGTMTWTDLAERPIETILSGPAASITGALALNCCQEQNFVVVDIGGTTTDLAAIVHNQALFERTGATICGYKTLVPALLTRSVGLGGDSELHFSVDGKIKVGPKRAGNPICLGGKKPTPIDAAVALGLVNLGSHELACRAWHDLGSELAIPWGKLAQSVIEAFTAQLKTAIEALYAELENVPLYTISEVLNPPEVRPYAIVGLGAPAGVFIPNLAREMKLTYEIVPFSEGANAIGAAAAQPTIGTTLHVDTELAKLTIPEMGYYGAVDKPLFFSLDKARKLALSKTEEHARNHGHPVSTKAYVVEEECFKMVRGFRTVGRTIMIKTQLRPQISKIRGEQDYEPE